MTRRRREAGFEVVSILLCVPAYDAVLMPLARRVTGVRRSPAVLMPPRSCSGSASAEPPAPTEEPRRRSTSHRRQEKERVGRASGGGAEEFRLFLGEGEISRLVVANDDDDAVGSSKNVGADWIFGGRIWDFSERLRRKDTLRQRTDARGLVKAWYRVAMFGDEGPSLVAIPSST
ncbi:hypothetical protein OsJ_35202 [Oryza sativa Japonica Group]|uniref:Uncharacterized protein n=2 Tax=Oryza sativa subsp. japonica TaxID=39947 RepID=A0A8J8YKJ3_ORYSJ|nr:hypothetical protein LOC_Os12g05030 [Oryza sativa Japonica Group]EAZ19626.1 hypothetical protein OsJ_35202 [Oryza sativa Japonica Group]